ncbi:hypothetical protein [Aeromicrobium alkaliterrae]|uniref:Septum formation-related domain-containing protein n=1 Tax=Aeromicrobium alkaliterrae TaxID=302168 RepID=A0ABN2JLH9_9ACTN
MSSMPPPNPFAPPGQTSVATAPPPPAPNGGPTPATPQGPQQPVSRRELMAQLAASRKKAGWALGLAITGIGSTVALILALIVLCGPRDGLRRGRGMAWTALVVLVAWSAASVWAYVTLAGATGVERASDGEVIQGGEVLKEDLRIGDCLDEAFDAEVGPVEQGTIAVLPCDELHTAQVIQLGMLPEGAYPGQDAVLSQAEQFCMPHFQPWVGTPYESSNLLLGFYAPAQESWDQSRAVVCVVSSEDEVVGTFQGSNS